MDEQDTSDSDISKDRLGPDVIKGYLKTLPNGPGVYRMIDQHADVLYVGKARNIKKRVTAYTKLGGHSNRIARMIAATREMDFISTNTETEALLLEANLIKTLKPRYNVLLRDDKSFPHILVRQDHDFAQILKHRGAQSKNGKYFGPFASAGAVNRTLNALQKAFLLRSCSDSTFHSRSRPCLLYQIKRCSGPCVDLISKQDYDLLVEEAVSFLKGKSRKTQEALAAQMQSASEALDFERAAVYRDRINALTSIQAHQGVNPERTKEADVIAAYADGGQTCVQVFFFRGGQNWGNRAYYPKHDKAVDVTEVLSAFVAQFYDDKTPPSLVLVNQDLDDLDLLSEALTIKKDKTVKVRFPKRGEQKDLIDHVAANAKDALGRRLAESASQRKILESLADLFDLERTPERIEVYDNSHIQGANAVGGMIVSGPEGFIKNQYRKFNIKDTELTPGDDYGMMREVLSRRFSRLIKETKDVTEGEDRSADARPWPDIVLIDGGAGQLSAAQEVMTELGVEDLCIVSIAKGPDRNAGRERFFMKGRQPFSIEEKSPVLYFLQRLRDEAHRFAIGSHRNRRSKSIHSSPLDEIDGIGAKRKKALLHHFGSAKAVRQAGLPDLEAVDGISRAIAKKIYDHFQKE